MKIWVVVLFLAIQILAARLAFAEEVQATSQAPAPAAVTIVSSAVDAKPVVPVDECKDTLPQLENEYSQVVMDIRGLNQNLNSSHDEYLKSFREMTQALVDISQKREDELQKIMESRQALQAAMQKFTDDSSQGNSKNLQDSYMNLTVRLYAQAMEGTTTIDALKNQLGGVEAARGQYEVSQKSQADLDEKKLALEGKMASLKIRCRKN